jgi:hypothetical protein
LFGTIRAKSLTDYLDFEVFRKIEWGVVFGGDTALDAARHEIEVTAPKLEIPNASIYLREGSYRSVSVVEDRSQAEQVLSKAKTRRADSYIVNMSTWCPRTNEKPHIPPNLVVAPRASHNTLDLSMRYPHHVFLRANGI